MNICPRIINPCIAAAIGIAITMACGKLELRAQTAGEEMLKTDILVVLAHPDDEIMMASTVAYYAKVQGKKIAHVYCTRGEGGGNMVGRQWGPSLGILRERELQKCLDTLGVDACYFLDQVDWAYTESAAMTLEKWDHEGAVERLARLIRVLRPDVLLTMSPYPRPGWHGHHQAAGMLAVEASAAAANPDKFTRQISREGLSPWRVPKLYYRGSRLEGVPATVAAIEARAVLPDGKSIHETAGEALSYHKSQGFGRRARFARIRPPESFVLLRQSVLTESDESNLFAGLDTATSAAGSGKWMQPESVAESSAPIIEFAPRPAITAFLHWAEENGVRHLAGAVQPDVPVVRGEETTVDIRLKNLPTNGARTIRLSSLVPGVRLPDSINLGESPTVASVPVFVPDDFAEDFKIEATLVMEDEPAATASITLHPVPLAKSSPAPVGTHLEDGKTWQAFAELRITPDLIVQGKVSSPEDCSAICRVANDGATLFVEVDVTDDAIVSNIAPNDIRGHWRSDSVEVCIDPGGSQHTLTCFKLGIFPFDSAGEVRAARDADANQGPVEETSPGTRLFSERFADGSGYRIRTAIPLADAGITDAGSTIGFNVIIYDGDKVDAAVGENINEARIAWSPRSGVQGRPEDWGRLKLMMPAR